MSNIIDSIQLSGTVYTLSAQTSGGSGATVSEVTQAQYDALVSGGTVDPTVLYIITDAQAGDLTQYWTSAQTKSAITQATSGKVNTSSVVSSVTSASTDSEIPTAKAVFDAIPTGGTGGGKAISAGTNISVTTGETADTVSCTLKLKNGSGYNSIVGNGNGLEANGGRSFAFGSVNKANGDYDVLFGYNNNSKGGYETKYAAIFGANNKRSGTTSVNGFDTYDGCSSSFVCGSYNDSENGSQFISGYYNKSYNFGEATNGVFNNSVSASTTFGHSGNTLFSVGNGTSTSNRHNAFEIRQNGDIYLTSGSTDIKLQDYLGGGGSSITVSSAITSGDTNAVAGGAVYNRFDEVEQVTARALNQLSEGQEVAARALIDINDSLSGKVDTSAFTTYSAATNTVLNNKVDKSAVVSSVTSASTDSQIPTAKAVYDSLGSISGGITSGEVQSMINSSISGKVDTDTFTAYSSATDNEIYALQNDVERKVTEIMDESGGYRIAFSYYNSEGQIDEIRLFEVGDGLNLGYESGNLTLSVDVSDIHTSVLVNDANFATSGYVNNVVSDKQDTLVSGQNIKTINNESILGSGNITIQGGGGTVSSAITSGDTNAVAGGAVYDKFDEIEQVTARALNSLAEADEVAARALVDLNDRFGGLKFVKLTQSEYDALSGSTDSNTLYVIVN